jgi:uncharacterized protein (DUF2336 family)
MTLEKLMAELAERPAKDPATDLRTLRDAFVKRSGRTSEAELVRFAEMASTLLSKVPLIERMAFARQLAKHRSTPRKLLTLLTGDHYLVSAPVLESAPMLDETDLVEVINRFGAPVCLAIAKREGLSVQLTDRLMADAEPKVYVALAENTNARLSRKTMTTLCDLAEADEDIRKGLGRRRDLPLALSSRLKSIGGQSSVAPAPSVPVSSGDSGPAGRGRAGIVLSPDMLNPTKPKQVKTIRYS